MIKKIFRSVGLRQTLLLSGGNLGASFFSAAALILISRILSPSLFGEFTVGYSLIIIIYKIQGIGLNAAIQRVAGKIFHENTWKKKFSQLLQVGMSYNIFLFLLFLVGGILISYPLSLLLHIESPFIIFGAFLAASVTVFFEYFTNIYQTLHKFSMSVTMMWLQSLLKLSVALSIFFLKIENVILLFYLFYLVPIFSIIYGWQRLPQALHIFPPKRDRVVESELSHVLKNTAISMATLGLIEYLDILFVKHYTTPFSTGIYGGIPQLGSAVSLVGYSIAAVLNARVARYHSKSDLDQYIKKASVFLLVALSGFIFYLPLARLSILGTIGPHYIAGLPYISLLMASSFLFIATVPFIALFYSFGSATYFSVSGILQLCIVLIGGVTLIPHFGLAGAVWLKVISKAFLFLFTIIWAYSAYKKKIHAEY